jgi:hypothetical protein
MKLNIISQDIKMKVREIITEKGIAATVVGKAADLFRPAAIRQAAKAAEKAHTKAELAMIGGVLGNWWKVIRNVALAWGFLEPMVATAIDLSKLKKQLDAGDITPQDYEAYVQGTLGKCVAQIATIGVTTLSVTLVGKLIGSLPFGKKAGKLISLLGGTAAASFGVYLTTPLGARQFAQWFVGESFAPWLAEFMRDWVGSWTKEAYDALTGHEDARGPIQGSATGNSVSDAFKDIPQAANPMGMKFDSGTGAWTNRSSPNSDGSN